MAKVIIKKLNWPTFGDTVLHTDNSAQSQGLHCQFNKC